MTEQIFEGKTLEEAKLKAAQGLGIAEESLEFEVLEKPSNMLMNFIKGGSYKIKILQIEEVNGNLKTEENRGNYKSEPAREVSGKVENELSDEDDAVIARAKEIILKVVHFIDSAATLQCNNRNEELQFNIMSKKGNVLIGRNGDTLNALQYIVIKMLNREIEFEKRILVDVEGYIKRKRRKIIDLALQTASKVKQAKKPISLDPMPSYERWIIHNELSDEAGIVTRSYGEGRDRRVVIIPDKFKNMEDKLILKYFMP
jgi:spoIIIJ-associated protein